jgi:transmembrane sensor
MIAFEVSRSSGRPDPVTDRAATFFEKRRFGDWNGVDQAEFEAWLEESPFHRIAYLRLEGIAAYADHLAVTHRLEMSPKLFGWRRVAGKRLAHLVLPLLAAASVVLAATFGGPFIASLLQPPDRVDSTDVGGRTLLSFADHTQIELNTNTAVRLRMTTAERTVWLEKGEAWFHVAHDAAHPFTVIAGKHRITDLGTEFLVRRDAVDVDVTLLNGRAALSTEGLQTATLGSGEEAIATATALSVTRKTPRELADDLAWRRGMLVFRKTKLADVVREFNRYNATKLVIADPSIAGEPFTADLKTDDYEDFLTLAQAVLNLRVDHEGNEILIYRRHREDMKKAARVKRGD